MNPDIIKLIVLRNDLEKALKDITMSRDNIIDQISDLTKLIKSKCEHNYIYNIYDYEPGQYVCDICDKIK